MQPVPHPSAAAQPSSTPLRLRLLACLSLTSVQSLSYPSELVQMTRTTLLWAWALTSPAPAWRCSTRPTRLRQTCRPSLCCWWVAHACSIPTCLEAGSQAGLSASAAVSNLAHSLPVLQEGTGLAIIAPWVTTCAPPRTAGGHLRWRAAALHLWTHGQPRRRRRRLHRRAAPATACAPRGGRRRGACSWGCAVGAPSERRGTRRWHCVAR